MQRPESGPGLRLVPDAPDGSGFSSSSESPRSGLPPTAAYERARRQLYSAAPSEPAAAEISGLVRCLLERGYSPLAVRVCPGGAVFEFAEDADEAP